MSLRVRKTAVIDSTESVTVNAVIVLFMKMKEQEWMMITRS